LTVYKNNIQNAAELKSVVNASVWLVMHCQTTKVEEYNKMRFWICLMKVYYCKDHVKFNHNHHTQYSCQ
jgi:hypothetical protein